MSRNIHITSNDRERLLKLIGKEREFNNSIKENTWKILNVN